MNEKRVRKAAASVLALTMAASLTAVFVGANNYYKPPNYQPVSAGGSYSAPKNPQYKKEQKTTASILTAKTVVDAIKNANGKQAVVDLSKDNKGNVTVMEDAVAAIAKGDTDVAVRVSEYIGEESLYTVELAPGRINHIDGALNIGMNFVITKKMSRVNGIKVPSNTVVLSPKAKGEYGTTLKVTVSNKAFTKMKASKIRPYAIYGSGDNATVVRLADDEFVLNDDGSISILIDTGDAVIVYSDKDIVKANKK